MTDLLQKFARLTILDPQPEIQRQQCQMHPVGTFIPADNTYLGQFNHIYNDRLDKLRKRFGHQPNFQKISMVQENRTVICGLLHKRYKKKGQNMEKNLEVPNPNLQVYSLEDEAELADESGSIRIAFNERTIIHRGDFNDSRMEMEATSTIHDLPHGACFLAEGQLDETINSFVCSLVQFPQLPPQIHMVRDNPCSHSLSHKEMIAKLQKGDELVLITSCLTGDNFEALEQFVKGVRTSPNLASRITSVVICGGVLGGMLEHQALREIDEQLNSLAQLVTVFYMPSNNDFKDPLWPVKPITKYLLPNSANRLYRCSNPQLLEVGRLTLLGTCGENVQEMRRVCTLKDSLDIMEAHLMFNHLAPSSPSSLLTAPALKDSMVIDNLPNVYFAGGNDTFLSRTLTINKQSCKLLLIPPFQEGIVLMNSRSTDTSFLSLC